MWSLTPPLKGYWRPAPAQSVRWKNKGRVHFVVVFNLTRVARDKYDHFALRSHLQSLGISLRSATEPIDDTSTGKLMEGAGHTGDQHAPWQ
jgi:DNA invertase Pin-like site-specific DNA recombinase